MEVLAQIVSGGGTAQWVFLAGLGLVIAVLLMRSKRYFRQVTKYQVPVARPKTSAEPQRRPGGQPRELEQWEVSMHELARDLSAQLDSKIRVVELLIRQANEAAARLEAAMAGKSNGKHEPQTARTDPLSRGARAALDAPTPRDQTQGMQPLAFQAPEPSPKPPPPAITPGAALKIAGNPRFERVYALADAGLSTTTIANQIGSQVGEVELILSLRGKRSA